MSGSLATFYSPRITGLPSTASTAQEVKYWAQQATLAMNGLPNFSIFSWSTPNSNETAQYPALGFNLTPNSVSSILWLKVSGSGNTGWAAIHYGPEGAPGARSAAHAHRTSVLTVSKNSATVVSFSTTDFDTTSIFDGTSKFVIPTYNTGVWEFRAHITWAPNAAGGRQCDIYKNGSLIASNHVLGSNDTQSQHLAVLANNPAVGDYFQVIATQSSAGDLSLLSEPEHTFFEAIQIW